MTVSRATRMALAALVLLPGVLAAHEGHGPEATAAGVVHQLASPYHLVGVVALVAVVGGLILLRAARCRAASPPGGLPLES